MTGQYFENDFIKLHYYRFGSGDKHMLCFHGLGMHGKQFKCLEETLGNTYTFWGFDLLFHKGTTLRDNSLPTIKAGFQKTQLHQLVSEFCAHAGINRFSVIGYSMGSYYASAIVETMPERVDEFIVAAPSCIRPNGLTKFLSKNPVGNRLFKHLALSDKGMTKLINITRQMRLIDKPASEILHNEVCTPELRLALYSCFTYLRFLEADEKLLIHNLNTFNIRSFFIFGERDKMYPLKMGKKFFPKLQNAKALVIDANHDMINQRFATIIYNLLK